MASRRSPVATTFIALLALGAFAVAAVVVAVTLNTSAAASITEAERNLAAVDLIARRTDLTSLFAAEEAATVLDLVNGSGSMNSAPVTAQRTSAWEVAVQEVAEIGERADSVGSEAQRWVAALRNLDDPAGTADPYERMLGYAEATSMACCVGVVPSEAHHTDAIDDLGEVGTVPASIWHYFYISVERATRQGPGIPTEVSRFMDYLGTPEEISADTPLPSNELSSALATLAEFGVTQDSINSLLAGDPVKTLDTVVLHAAGRSSVVVGLDETYAAADAVQRYVTEIVTRAETGRRQQLEDSIQTSHQVQLVARIVAPIVLLFLAILAFLTIRFSRLHRVAAQREQDLLDARNRFMRMVSHELRTPATAIAGFAEMLGSEWTSLTEAEIAEFLAIIDRQSTHLSYLVEDLLTLSHLETGRLRLHMGIVNLNQTAAAAVAAVDERYGLGVTTTIDPSLTVLADPDRLLQILRNLIENAAKYGKVGLAVSAAVVGSSCEIVVSDTGPGVPPDMAESIFKFWHRDAKSGTRVRGYGMGLAIARHLARAMVGDLVYRAHHPVGSELVLSLQIGPPDLTNSPDALADSRATS